MGSPPHFTIKLAEPQTRAGFLPAPQNDPQAERLGSLVVTVMAASLVQFQQGTFAVGHSPLSVSCFPLCYLLSK